MLLTPTQSLKTALGLSAAECPPAPPEWQNHPARWQGHWLRFGPMNMLALTHAKTHYTVLPFGVQKRDLADLPSFLMRTLSASFQQENWPSAFTQKALRFFLGDAVTCARLADRHLLGVQNEMIRMAKFYAQDHGGYRTMDRFACEHACNAMPLAGGWPREDMRKFLENLPPQLRLAE